MINRQKLGYVMIAAGIMLFILTVYHAFHH